MIITDAFVEKVACEYQDVKKVRSALTRALCMTPNPEKATEELVLRLAKGYLKDIQTKQIKVEVEIEKPKSKRGRKSLGRGKQVIGGTKNTYRCWWQENGDSALEMARDDSVFPEAQPGGNYALTKEFLRVEWKNKFEFTLPELKEALAEKYPEKADHSGFRLQRWGNASYWERTDGVAVKPIWKQLERKKYMNIFYVGE